MGDIALRTFLTLGIFFIISGIMWLSTLDSETLYWLRVQKLFKFIFLSVVIVAVFVGIGFLIYMIWTTPNLAEKMSEE